jgi:hypothetical protein
MIAEIGYKTKTEATTAVGVIVFGCYTIVLKKLLSFFHAIIFAFHPISFLEVLNFCYNYSNNFCFILCHLSILPFFVLL